MRGKHYKQVFVLLTCIVSMLILFSILSIHVFNCNEYIAVAVISVLVIILCVLVFNYRKHLKEVKHYSIQHDVISSLIKEYEYYEVVEWDTGRIIDINISSDEYKPFMDKVSRLVYYDEVLKIMCSFCQDEKNAELIMRMNLRNVKERILNEGKYIYDYKLYVNGVNKYHQATFFPISDRKKGTITHFIVSAQNITESVIDKEIEKENAKHYRKIVLSNALQFIVVNLTTNIVLELSIPAMPSATIDSLVEEGYIKSKEYDSVVDYWKNNLVGLSKEQISDIFSKDAMIESFNNGVDRINNVFKVYGNVRKSEMWCKQEVIVSRNAITNDYIATIIEYDVTDKMGNEELLSAQRKKIERHRRREALQAKALLSTALVIYYVNITKDAIESDIYYQKNNKIYDVLSELGLKKSTKYSEFIEKWKEYVDKEYCEGFDRFFDINQLKKRYYIGETEGTFTYKSKDITGNDIYTKQTLLLSKDPDTGDIHAFSYAMDITYEMKVLEQAKEANYAKTTFLFNMSHDIRTPMNAIIGYASMAESHVDNKEKTLNYLKKLQISSKQLLELINNVLDMARIESGKTEVSVEVGHIPTILNERKQMFSFEMNKKNIEFDVIYNVENEYIFLDKLKMAQIDTNLIGNAFKYTPEGGKVSYSLQELFVDEQGFVTFEGRVKDNGIGMSEEYQKNLFGMFERERNTTIAGIQGTGLGLAIVKNLIEMMGGSITCKSEQGVGTEFIYTVKARIADKELYENQSMRKKDIIDLQGIRILLVEDNELNSEIAVEILEETGCVVDIAKDGQDAVEKLSMMEKAEYDIILMDIQMPVMDGYTATKMIRKLPNKEVASTAIVAMTANAFEEDKQKAYAAGMNAHIAKPINTRDLFETIRSVM